MIISAHIAPGLDSHADHRQRMYDQFNDRIINILIQYSDVISSMHFGHDHADAFRVLLNSAGNHIIQMVTFLVLKYRSKLIRLIRVSAPCLSVI